MTPVRIWILLSTLLVASGWILSACHELNRAGYAVVFAVGIVASIVWQRRTGWRPNLARMWAKFRKRFKRAAPLLFLVLVIMSFIGPCLYVTQENDTNEYRVPRVWHWLAEGHWHWIRTMDIRSDVAGCGYEWLNAPLMLFTRTDRFIFLANWVSYLMLPGMIFSVFTRLGVRPKVAWWWMWLLSSAWCYVFQAGSTSNDALGVIYALASVDLALRAREKNYLPDLWLAILALGLMTGVKQTNLPLIFPGLAAILYCFPVLIRRPLASFAVGLASFLVSAGPIFYLTIHNTGKLLVNSATAGSYTVLWRGYDVPPLWGFIGNIFGLTVQNLHPPIFPWADRWNAAMAHFVQTPFGSHFSKFEALAYLQDGAGAGNSGIGLWLVLLTAISILAAALYRKTERAVTNGAMRWLRWIPFLSLVIFMAKDGSTQPARQMDAYYVFLFPALLVARGHGVLVSKNWWRGLVLASMVLTAGMLVVARDRPLFPAQTIFLHLKEKHPYSHFLARVWYAYSFQSSVLAQRAAFDNEIPPNEQVLGYATARGSQEAGKWVPFGIRRVVRVLPTDTPAQLHAMGIHYVLVDTEGLVEFKNTIGDWTNQLDGVLVGVTNFEATPGTIAYDYLVRLKPKRGGAD